MNDQSLSSPTLALIALGGNLPSSAGSPQDGLRSALRHLANLPEITIMAVSRLWSTPAWPLGSGPDYINAALAAKTRLMPVELLALLHRIEARFGRVRDGGRWQPRGLDLDLIAWGDAVLPDPATHEHWRALPPEAQARLAPEQLILPHPRMQDRGFVLAPLAEVAPAWVHPRLGRSVAQMLADLPATAMRGIRPATS
ncbi:MAG: 2-amino-4-hydroxy-6-hydroxymethyldihydropteridine diphosphokinase [Paracoccus sp. (in: a-proteobacteria)]|uniref:2-amino-4-hydroxy-6- hydroxymethyldihydropteridine diphosphokinase n=1 Tax=Paracoccus sp. TaxID=267 RepID=UPI0039E28C34